MELIPRFSTTYWFSLAMALGPAAAVASTPTQPNIVVLVADDWGFTDVGSFGGEIATPHLDELAHHGTRFSNFHVAASCAPSRSMLLTGVDNHLNGVGNLLETMPREDIGKPGYEGSLTQNVVTVASLLQDGGYHTYISGKWNVGTQRYNLPDRRGFEHSIVQGDTGADNWEPSKRYLPHGPKVQWFEDGKEADMPAEYYSSEYFVDRMLGYLKSRPSDGKPFFAYVGFQANHVPLQAPAAYIAKYRGRYSDGWTRLREQRRNKAAELGLLPYDLPMVTMGTTGDWNALSAEDRAYQERRMEVYAGMAEAMDFHAGRLIDYLKQSGVYDRTVFIFLSDNGPEASDYSEARLWLQTQYKMDIDSMGGKGGYGIMGPSWASASAAPFSTYKFYAGEGGIRVPLIISGVPGSPEDHIYAGLTHVTDITPTLLELAQIPQPGPAYKGQSIQTMRGHSLIPVLLDNSKSVRSAEEVLGYELSGNSAMFKGKLKLVRNMPPVGDGQWHLYDIEADPGETRDLKGQLPDALTSMLQDYDVYVKEHGVLPVPEGYSPAKQVTINSFYNYWLPAYGKKVAAALVLILLAAGVRIGVRRRRRRLGL